MCPKEHNKRIMRAALVLVILIISETNLPYIEIVTPSYELGY